MESDFRSLSIHTQLQLALGHPVTLYEAHAMQRIEVRSGIVWMTQHGHHEDTFLRAGECMPCNTREGAIVLECLSANAAVCVVKRSEALPALPVRTWLARVLHRLADWLEPAPHAVAHH
jgi:NaMN:DMB phosphoribosyltransferase